MKKTSIALAIVASLAVGCASTGVVPTEKGEFLIVKKSPQVGFGPPVGVKGDVYREANEHCGRSGQSVETLELKETPSKLAQSAAVSLRFRCVRS
jgi:hypothetical protein